jgi:hypothetical protein
MEHNKLKQPIAGELPTGTQLKSITAYANLGERLSATASDNTIPL